MMKILLDTHIILWFLANDRQLSDKAKEIILDEKNDIFYSTASVWEITIKHMANPVKMRINGNKFAYGCHLAGFKMIPINDSHVALLETLKRPEDAPPHKDPFDRIMIAQAKAEGIYFVTHDSLLPYYGESCLLSV